MCLPGSSSGCILGILSSGLHPAGKLCLTLQTDMVDYAGGPSSENGRVAQQWPADGCGVRRRFDHCPAMDLEGTASWTQQPSVFSR